MTERKPLDDAQEHIHVARLNDGHPVDVSLGCGEVFTVELHRKNGRANQVKITTRKPAKLRRRNVR